MIDRLPVPPIAAARRQPGVARDVRHRGDHHANIVESWRALLVQCD
jgi:hypothetical protein